MRDWIKKLLPGQVTSSQQLESAAVSKARGDELLAQGDWLSAEAAYRQALSLAPALAKAHGNLGFALQQQGRHAEARTSLEQALALDPANPDTHYMLGTLAVLEASRLDQAKEHFHGALRLQPDFEAAHLALIELLRKREPEAAKAAVVEALRACPASAALHRLNGELQFDGRRFFEAIASFRQAIALDAGSAEAWHGLGQALLRSGEHEEAEQAFERHIGLLRDQATDARGKFNLGAALMNQSRHAEAQACFEQSLVLEPDVSEVKIARGWLRLLLGDFEAGWRDYREVSHHSTMAAQQFHRPLWNGEQDIAGKSILLYADQGIGDALQFLRYVRELRARGALAVHLDVQGVLRQLVMRMPEVGQVLAKGESLSQFDFHSPLSHLPAACGTTLAAMPDASPYIAAPAEAEAWHSRLDGGAGRRIGVVWSGNPQFHNDRMRSMYLSDLLPLFDSPACRFYLLQKDVRADDKSDLERLLASGLPVQDLGPELDDFVTTAAIVANLDLVITVDTSVAHLAGAMGKPVWLMLPHAADFRWLLERKDSPWYPSACLFRQPRAGDWPAVVEAMRATLAAQAR